ncbi:hypothetical protein TWF281_004071 [Arthrobotrys megalospora]
MSVRAPTEIAPITKTRNEGTATVQRDTLFPTVDIGLLTAKGAAFGDYVNQNEPECLSGTRIDLLDQITNWAKDPEGKSIFWMYGMAGTGKSTISRTVSRLLQTNNLLGGSFFFKRGEADRTTGALFFMTLATQLATSLRGNMATNIRGALIIDPKIPEKTLEVQFNKLIYDPLSRFRASGHNVEATRVVVVDALDECEKKEDVRIIIQQLARLKHLTNVDVRVFLTSRPDLPIIPTFQRLSEDTYDGLVLHEVPHVEDDLALFLKTELSAIAEERGLPCDWPGPETVRGLLQISYPLFIYATTICRFVGDENWDPNERIQMITKYESRWQTSQLDKTYLPILEQVLASQGDIDKERFIQEFKDIVGAIIVLESPLSVRSLVSRLELSTNLFMILSSIQTSVINVSSGLINRKLTGE